jgi:hypothetical protein
MIGALHALAARSPPGRPKAIVVNVPSGRNWRIENRRFSI